MKKKDDRVVEIDDRLTDLFVARRSQVSGKADADQTDDVLPNDLSWLKEFQNQTSTTDSSNPIGDLAALKSTIKLDLSTVRPFWALEERAAMISLWKRSKLWLAKDCQKQKKAAIRKTSHKVIS
jgi:hypothetical protein